MHWQGQCKPNAIELARIAEVQPVLATCCKFTMNLWNQNNKTQNTVDGRFNFSSEFNTPNRKLFLRNSHFSSGTMETFPQCNLKLRKSWHVFLNTRGNDTKKVDEPPLESIYLFFLKIENFQIAAASFCNFSIICWKDVAAPLSVMPLSRRSLRSFDTADQTSRLYSPLYVSQKY